MEREIERERHPPYTTHAHTHTPTQRAHIRSTTRTKESYRVRALGMPFIYIVYIEYLSYIHIVYVKNCLGLAPPLASELCFAFLRYRHRFRFGLWFWVHYIFSIYYIHIYIHYINPPWGACASSWCVRCVFTIICVGFSWSKSLWLNATVAHTRTRRERLTHTHLLQLYAIIKIGHIVVKL